MLEWSGVEHTETRKADGDFLLVSLNLQIILKKINAFTDYDPYVLQSPTHAPRTNSATTKQRLGA